MEQTIHRPLEGATMNTVRLHIRIDLVPRLTIHEATIHEMYRRIAERRTPLFAVRASLHVKGCYEPSHQNANVRLPRSPPASRAEPQCRHDKRRTRPADPSRKPYVNSPDPPALHPSNVQGPRVRGSLVRRAGNSPHAADMFPHSLLQHDLGASLEIWRHTAFANRTPATAQMYPPKSLSPSQRSSLPEGSPGTRVCPNTTLTPCDPPRHALQATRPSIHTLFFALLLLVRLVNASRARSWRPRPGAEIRILGVALILADRVLNDNAVSVKRWARLMGLAPSDVVTMQMEFLRGIGFNLSTAGYSLFLGRLLLAINARTS
ncbi:hypothetical protein BDK51DRAFT_44826 [Blyttiomyces helicus]|uniref:Cyclin N-terminal domain-containing protein n=1 Tax=Blyttiomyces helicus TaxID=388810 RepID=A0A4P9WBR7_9FUNG|nr:hypothetical protein BDK51DRAFT_44826 [Blyttiomyces helicus]|eukprot:RKO89003.1 hypothetical protein BDK51DRAFT_44826 [Blyttiomyces helicus]